MEGNPFTMREMGPLYRVEKLGRQGRWVAVASSRNPRTIEAWATRPNHRIINCETSFTDPWDEAPPAWWADPAEGRQYQLDVIGAGKIEVTCLACPASTTVTAVADLADLLDAIAQHRADCHGLPAGMETTA